MSFTENAIELVKQTLLKQKEAAKLAAEKGQKQAELRKHRAIQVESILSYVESKFKDFEAGGAIVKISSGRPDFSNSRNFTVQAGSQSMSLKFDISLDYERINVSEAFNDNDAINESFELEQLTKEEIESLIESAAKRAFQ